ncbi:MAG TPA: hypothetical protein VD994_07545 [Prosthecobacter sp.]|nr:hypothetical protein [Prosthecobacter sp.]
MKFVNRLLVLIALAVLYIAAQIACGLLWGHDAMRWPGNLISGMSFGALSIWITESGR